MIALRLAFLAAAVSPLVLTSTAVQASPLSAVNQALQPCLVGGQPKACPAALRVIDQLQATAEFLNADSLCKQQLRQFKDVVALMAIRDTTPIEAQGTFDAVARSAPVRGSEQPFSCL